MSRLIAVDTETTGLKSKEGDRIIEIALVEISRSPDAPHYHAMFNPEGRAIAESATEVHGITDDMLLDKPLFRDCIPDMLEFIGDDVILVIHNAGFDLEFLRDEFLEAGMVWPEVRVIDTMKDAIREFPAGSRVTLDALCNRFGVDLSSRTKHGALIDTRLLAKLYLAWKGQSGLDFSASPTATRSIVDTESLGAMNDVRVRIPEGIREAPPAPNWSRHFEGVDL